MSNELSAQREVTLFYTQSNERKTLQSTAKTWGELSNEIGESFAKSKVVLQSTRMTLENTAAQLPNEPFTLFVFPRQSKAGVSNKDRDWSKMKYNELRGVASKLNKTKNAGINMSGSKDTIAIGVSKFYGGTGKFSAPAPKAKAKAKPAKAAPKKETPKAQAKPSPAKAKAEKSEGTDLNEKLSKANGKSNSGMSAAQYNGIISKLDTIIDTIDAATPTMDTKALNKLKDQAATIRGDMQTMK